jgi:hypothetical protein
MQNKNKRHNREKVVVVSQGAEVLVQHRCTHTGVVVDKYGEEENESGRKA